MQWFADRGFYIGVDCLISAGVLHDILLQRRVYPVYRIALPSLVALQLFGVYVAFTPDPTWIRIATWILS